MDKRAQQPLQLALTLKDFCPSQMSHPHGHSEQFKAFRGWIVVSKQGTLGDLLPDPTNLSAKLDGFVTSDT